MTAPATPGQFPDRLVIEMECGITVYPAREERGRWRAVWYENGQRQQCEAVTEDRLAARLDKVAEQVSPADRQITVNRKVVEVSGACTWTAEEPQVPPHDLSRPRAWRLPARRAAGRPRHAGTGGAKKGHQLRRSVVSLIRGKAARSSNLTRRGHPPRLPHRRVARLRWQRSVDLAQPAPRVLHHRLAGLKSGPHRHFLHGRGRQLPRHPRHVRRHHRWHPRLRPSSNRVLASVGVPHRGAGDGYRADQ